LLSNQDLAVIDKKICLIKNIGFKADVFINLMLTELLTPDNDYMIAD